MAQIDAEKQKINQRNQQDLWEKNASFTAIL